MSRLVYYTAMSLDGYVATREHDLSWLLSRDGDPEGPLGFSAFERRVGAIVMGRSTFDWVAAHLPPEEGWPHHQPCWVVTSRAIDPGRFPTSDIRATSAPAAEVVAQMRAAAGDLDLWCVGGGRTATWLHDSGLLDEVWVSIAPVLLGAGIPVVDGHVELDLVDVDRNRDFAVCRYRVSR